MDIRPEKPKDYAAVRVVNESAFETTAEANLVDRLRESAHPVISLVAEGGNEIVGHILFSPVKLSGHDALQIMGLAPMAVVPEQQGKGIGSLLVKAGLQKCIELGAGAVVVLGHTWFYPRFGFVPSTRFGIRSEYDVPQDVFMVLELQPGYLFGKEGVIQYHPAFNEI